MLTLLGALTASTTIWILVAVLFLGGVQLMSIGVLGRYLAHVHDQVLERPLYLVSRVVVDQRRETALRASSEPLRGRARPARRIRTGAPSSPTLHSAARCALHVAARGEELAHGGHQHLADRQLRALAVGPGHAHLPHAEAEAARQASTSASNTQPSSRWRENTASAASALQSLNPQ